MGISAHTCAYTLGECWLQSRIFFNCFTSYTTLRVHMLHESTLQAPILIHIHVLAHIYSWKYFDELRGTIGANLLSLLCAPILYTLAGAHVEISLDYFNLFRLGAHILLHAQLANLK